MAQTLTLKRGASFGGTLTFSGPTLLAVWADLSARAQVRDAAGNLVEELAITKTGNAGQARIVSAGTGNWPLGRLRCDIRLSRGAPPIVDYSETFIFNIQPAVTQA